MAPPAIPSIHMTTTSTQCLYHTELSNLRPFRNRLLADCV
jgi:hypothetical protein